MQIILLMAALAASNPTPVSQKPTSTKVVKTVKPTTKKPAAVKTVPLAATGPVAAGMPNVLSVGLFEDTGNPWMRNSGVPWHIRYRYLTYPWASNWGNGPRDGAFVTEFFNETYSIGFMPAIAYYEMYDLPPGNTGYGAKANNRTSMLEYYQDFKLLMQRAKDFGRPVLVMVEADGFAYLQGDSGDNVNAPAAVANTGMPELATLPDTAAGHGLAFLAIRKAVGATNVVLGMHVSGWATGADLFHFSVTEPLQPAVDRVFAFLGPLGLNPNITGQTYDVLVGDPLDRDADYYRLTVGEDRWWDMADTASINSKSFNRYAEWVRLWNLKSGKRWVLWQVPIGNTQNTNTCASGYKDNRTEYFFGVAGSIHRQKFVDNGVISLLFGAGADCQTTQETDHQYLATQAGPYLRGPGIPLGVGAPPMDAGTPVVDAGARDSGVVDAGAPKPDAGTVDAGVVATAFYEFETDAQGWRSPGKVITAVAVSTLRSAAGSKSLSVKLGTAAGTQQVFIDNPPVPQGKTITYKVFLPTGTRVTSVQVYAQEGISTNWRWNGTWRQRSALTTNAWNTLTVPLPANSSALQSLGVEFTVKKGVAGELLYVDSVGWGMTVVVDAGVPVVVDAGTPPPVVDAGKPDSGTPVVPDAGVVDAGVIAGQIRVMPLGDSITAESWSWRCKLYQDMVAHGRSAVFVGNVHDQYDSCAPNHSGNSGWTIGDLQGSIVNWLATYRPDVVVLMAGTNDIAWWTTETGTQVANRLDALATLIQTQKPGVRLVINTIPPQSSSIIAPNNVDRALLTQQFNTRVRTLVAARVAAGQLVRLGDVNAVLSLSDLRDGIHPTSEAGIAKMEPVIWNAMQQLLP